MNIMHTALKLQVLDRATTGEGIVALYAMPNPFLLNKICFKPKLQVYFQDDSMTNMDIFKMFVTPIDIVLLKSYDKRCVQCL